MQIGDTVYWLSADGSEIVAGKVVAISPKTSHLVTGYDTSHPASIVVEHNGDFSIRKFSESWNNWYETPEIALMAGQQAAILHAQNGAARMGSLAKSFANIISPA